MYVCICNAVTDRQIREAAQRGITSLSELRDACGASGKCGCCAQHAEAILQEARGHRHATPDLQVSIMPIPAFT